MNYLPGALDLEDIPSAPSPTDTDNVLWFQHSVSPNSRTGENDLVRC